MPIEDVSEWLFCELPKLRAKVMECSAKDDYNIKDVFRCFVTLSRILPKNPTGEVDDAGLRRRCSAYGSRRYERLRKVNVIRAVIVDPDVRRISDHVPSYYAAP